MSDERKPDDGLNELLLRWRAPATSAALDERVMAAYRRTKPGRGVPRWIFWAPAVIAVSAIAFVVITRSQSARTLELDSVLDTAGASTSYVTSVNASGFVPLPDGKIVISKVGGDQ